MHARDSYEALAFSIERAILSDLAPTAPRPELAPTIEQTLLAEARANEKRLSFLRVAIVAAYLGASLVGLLRGAGGAATAPRLAAVALGTLWLTVTAALAFRLRAGWCPKWLEYAGPALDATMIWVGFIVAAAGREDLASPVPLGVVVVVAILAVLLTVSGALRLSRSSAELSTALAIGVFVYAAVASGLALHHVVLAAGTIFLIGALGTSVATLLKRVVTTQVERSTLSSMYREAQQTIDAREQVLKIVSHDLRNPLHTISMSTSLMLEVPLGDEERVKRLNMIKRAGERMNRMIQDLLDVAKFDAGRLAIEPRPVSASALVNEAVEMLRPIAAERKLALDATVADELPATQADAGRVLQVLSNLVGNAIKFTPAGGRIAIRVDSAGGVARFAVSDTGPGIPTAQLPLIFGRFWQANPNDRRGIGLGLAIAKGIVEAHGGRIWCESRLGEGTTFYFTLAAGADTRRSTESLAGLRMSRAEVEVPVQR
ncbi:MAG: hypothetical protein HOQ09_15075 [Gemmatimonadaceae bacterium]|nr:hypothetical protein [Gemmatimonadaceae bacterium]